MDSIEDILNAEESDDDFLADNIDLELLLHSRDDFDEAQDDDQYLKPDQLRGSKPNKGMEIDSTVSVKDPSSEKDESGARAKITSVCVQESLPDDLSTDDTELDNVESNIEDSLLSPLRQAEQRERKFLECGQKNVVSALQSKRSSDVVLSYSNVRCDELSLISDQLKRNSNYKQHGPGAATSMIANEQFVAVGTSKGLIILFGHTQDIRCVLGSSLSTESRPSSAVTSLDALGSVGLQQPQGKPLEGLLVSGYATGALALWDIAKGTILRLITDLHSAAVVTSSILGSTSDGLANIGSGGGGGEEENLISLPSVWLHQHEGSNSASAREAPVTTGSTLSSFRFGFSSSIASVSGSGNSSSSSTGMQSASVVLISVDSQGVTYKTRFSKTMWSSAFASESECLLDASTGPLSGYAPLPPLLRSMQANSPHFYQNRINVSGSKVRCRYVAAHRSARMLAINVGKSQTWIVQTHPKVRILFKWEAPSEVLEGVADTTTADPAPAAVTTTTLPFASSRCLDWTWVAQQQQGWRGATGIAIDPQQVCPIITPLEDAQHVTTTAAATAVREEPIVDWVPTLARSWGEWVEVLSIITAINSQQVGGTVAVAAAAVSSSSVVAPTAATAATADPTSAPAPVPASASEKARPSSSSSSSPYQTKFSVAHRGCFVGQKILSLRWVSSVELVIFTTSDVIVTSPMLEVLEKYPLQPSLSMHLHSVLRFTGPSSMSPATAAAAAVVDNNHDTDNSNAVVAMPAPATALCDSVCGRQLFIFADDVLMSVQMQSCFDLADRLVGKGQWLEALALVLENVRRSPSMLQLYSAEVDKYIVRYAELSVKHSGPSSAAVSGGSGSGSGALSMANAIVGAAQNKNHFHLVAGVCIEYCVACSRLDLLFSRVYHAFKSVQRHYIFLESLEPFILSGDISSLPPALIAEFCESALRLNRLPSIERCVPYFEIAHLDINFITKFLYENRMYSSFLYVYAHGLNDFSGAFQIIFNFMLVVSGGSRSGGEGNGGGASTPVAATTTIMMTTQGAEDAAADLAEVGYKLLLFLCYSFEGKVFPRGCPMQQQQPYGDVTWQLLQLVTAPDLRPTPSIFSLQSSAELLANAMSSRGAYPYLSQLCQVDMAALLHALHKGVALVQSHAKPAALKVGLSSVYVNILNFCVRADQEGASNGAGQMIVGPGLTEKAYFEEFADLIVHSRCCLPLTFLQNFVQYCAISFSASGVERANAEKKLVTLAVCQPKEDSAHCAALASLLAEHNFGLACLHAARSPFPSSSAASVACASSSASVSAEQFRRCLSFYVKEGTDSPEEMKGLAFQYIDEAMRTTLRCEYSRRENYVSLLRAEVVKMLVPLCYLDLHQTRSLVENYLSAHVAEIMDNSAQDLKMQYALLSALVPSSATDVLPGLPGDKGRALKASFSEPALIAYFSLLATYDPANALHFLRSFESHYPLDACLQICQQKGISEAVAFLMERKGDVLDALLLLLRDVSAKLKQVRRDVDAQLRSEMATQAAAAKVKLQRVGSGGGGTGGGGGGGNAAGAGLDGDDRYTILRILGKQDVERAEAARRLPAFRMLESLVTCVAELCSRNHHISSLAADQGGSMWLTAFDHLLMERQMVRAGAMSSSGEVLLVLIGLMLQTLMNHTLSSTSTAAPAAAVAAAAITPQDIIRRVTAQGNAAGIRLGEFKSIMLNMLSSNAHELQLQSLTNDVIRTDLAALHKQKIATLKRYAYRSACYGQEAEEEEMEGKEENLAAAETQEGDANSNYYNSIGRWNGGNQRKDSDMFFRRRYNLPPPLRIDAPSKSALSLTDTGTVDDASQQPTRASLTAAFIQACRSRPPPRQACDYSQLRSDALVSQASSLRLVLATSLLLPPPPAAAAVGPLVSSSALDVDNNSSETAMMMMRQPGRLQREPLYLASM